MVHGGMARVRDFGGVGVGRYWLSVVDHNKKSGCKLIGGTAPGRYGELCVGQRTVQTGRLGRGNELRCALCVRSYGENRGCCCCGGVYKFRGHPGKKYKLQLIRLWDKRIQVRINTIVSPEREKQRRLPDAANNTTPVSRYRPSRCGIILRYYICIYHNI